MHEQYYYYDQVNGKYEKTTKDDTFADHVMIPKKKYHQLLGSRRIQQDRALQIADKNITDEHGYATLQLTHYEEKGHTVYEITKLTPYLLKVPIELAYDLIKQDLIDYYQFLELPILKANDTSFQVSTDSLFKYRHPDQRKKFWKNYSLNKCINEELISTVQWMDDALNIYDYPRNIFAYEIKNTSHQMPQGLYVVTYKSTGIL